MAGIIPDISTSSFKPLSLDEILMVPLAKQQQEDTAQLQLDEFAALESQALGPDKDYVSGQIGAFKKEATGLSDQLMNEGVDRNFINKTKSLRNRKTNELSLTGKTGQAAAAYNQYKANEANIMKDPRLTAQQKQLGLQEALTNYKGVAEGGQYKDYVGTAHVGIQDKAYEVAARMQPQEIADSLGIDVDKDGYYTQNGIKTKILEASQIERVIRQALEGDQDLMAYAQEMERLGISTVDKELSKAAQNAGNVFQRKDINRTSSLLPAGMQPNQIDSSKGIIAPPDHNWESRMDIGTQGAFNQLLKIPEDSENYESYFKPDGSFTDQKQITEKYGVKIPQVEKPSEKEIEDAKAYIEQDKIKDIKLEERNKDKHLFNKESKPLEEFKARTEAEDILKRNKTYNDRIPNKVAKDIVKDVREKNPVWNELKPEVKNPDGTIKEPARKWNDKEVYTAYIGAKKRSALTASQVISPRNPENTFYAVGDALLGKNGSLAGIVQKNISLMLPSGEKGGYRVMMEKLGYTGAEAMDDFLADLKAGGADSYSPGIPDMPGARRISFINSNTNKAVVMFAEPSIEEAKAFANVNEINKLIYSGEPFKELGKTSKNANQYAVAELRPETGQYEGATIITQPGVELTHSDMKEISYEAVISNGILQPGLLRGTITSGPNKGEEIIRYSLDAEIQFGITAINKYNDTTRNVKTSAKLADAGKQ